MIPKQEGTLSFDNVGLEENTGGSLTFEGAGAGATPDISFDSVDSATTGSAGEGDGPRVSEVTLDTVGGTEEDIIVVTPAVEDKKLPDGLSIDMGATNQTLKTRNIMFGRAGSDKEDHVAQNVMFDTHIDGVDTRVLQKLQKEQSLDTNKSWEQKWIKKSMEIELKDAKDKGITQLAVPLSSYGLGDGQPDVVSSTAQQVAKQAGAEYSVIEHARGSRGEGIKEPTAIIKLPSEDKEYNGLNSSADSLLSFYNTSVSDGYNPNQIQEFSDSRGDGEDMRFILSAKESGYSDEDIIGFMSAPDEVKATEIEFMQPAFDKFELDARTTPKAESFARVIDTGRVISLEDSLANFKVIYPNMTTMFLRTSAWFGDEAAYRQAEEANRAQAQHIVNGAKAELGLDMRYEDKTGKYFVQFGATPMGNAREIEVPEGFLSEMDANSSSIILATIGAFKGIKVANSIKWLPKHWTVNAGASILGTAVGAMGGAEIDYLISSMRMQTQMSANVAAHKAYTAAEASIVGDVIGFGVLKGLGKGWEFSSMLGRQALNGNTKAGRRAIQDNLFVSDAQAGSLIDKTNRLLVKPLEGGTDEKTIAALALTQNKGELILDASSQIGPKAAMSAAKAVDTRAKDLLATVDKATDDNIGMLLRDDLANYISDVKDLYSRTISQVASSPYLNRFRFKFDKLGIGPSIEGVKRGLRKKGDIETLDKFSLQAQYIQGLSETSNLADLIDIRQLINKSLFNKSVVSVDAKGALLEVKNRIDEAIRVGSKAVLGSKSDKWLSDFDMSNKEWGLMKKLEENVLYRSLTAPNIKNENVVNSLTESIGAIDSTFAEVMLRLPKSVRVKTEASVVDMVTNKYTIGHDNSFQAVHYPLLNDALQKMEFVSPWAREYKAMVGEFSEVFMNDAPISQMTGSISTTSMTNYLSADPVFRAKMELANTVMSTVKQNMPGESNNNRAMLKSVAKLLHDPLNSRSARDVMDEMANSVDISPRIVKLQQEAASRAASMRDARAEAVSLYGETHVKMLEGVLKNADVPPHRIATYKEMKIVADQDGITMTDVESLDHAMKSRGWLGVQQGSDRVRMLK